MNQNIAQKLLDEYHHPILFVNFQGDINYANDITLELLEYTQEELYNLKITQIDSLINDETWQDIIEIVHEDGFLISDSHFNAKSGKNIALELYFKIIEENEDHKYIVVSGTSLEARKSIEAHLIVAREKAFGIAQKLEDKTELIEKSLTEIRQLKTKQDGDLFLTSLLLKPFQYNKVTSENVKIETFIKQKVQFSYRKWNSEIGGDICISQDVFLANKKYSVFLIADAMGKAIQGAGGALVLATIFITNLKRTEKSFQFRNHTPERWMSLIYEEFNSGFQGFDGTMMMSLILGLIDNDTGLMYYFNSEQPCLVSKFNGTVTKIENQISQKVGMPFLTLDKPKLNLYHIRDGEEILMGSDGRDDIRISADAGKINEDEYLFLRIAEKANFDLKQIFKISNRIGELIDDYSLLKISYSNNETNNRHVQLKTEINSKLRQNDLLNIGEMLVEYIALKPQDNNAIYLYSVHLGKQDKIMEAINQGERINYRHLILKKDLALKIENLNHLIRLYIKADNLKRATQLLEKSLEISPNYVETVRTKKTLAEAVNLNKPIDITLAY